MFTRQDYMQNLVTHDQYYGQFVTPYIVATVRQAIGADKIKASTDPHFNDIPLKHWDGIGLSLVTPIAPKLKEAGDICSLGSLVCVVKAAARVIKQEV